MTHDEARELIGGDPDQASAELLAHLKNVPGMPGLSRGDARTECQAPAGVGVGLAEGPADGSSGRPADAGSGTRRRRPPNRDRAAEEKRARR